MLPDEITKILGCSPSHSQMKGEVITVKKTGRERIIKTGMWRVNADDRAPGDIAAQISEILNKLTKDFEAWKSLSEKYEIDLFCGLFMDVTNEVLTISPQSLGQLGSRGIKLSLDIYGPEEEKEQNT